MDRAHRGDASREVLIRDVAVAELHRAQRAECHEAGTGKRSRGLVQAAELPIGSGEGDVRIRVAEAEGNLVAVPPGEAGERDGKAPALVRRLRGHEVGNLSSAHAPLTPRLREGDSGFHVGFAGELPGQTVTGWRPTRQQARRRASRPGRTGWLGQDAWCASGPPGQALVVVMGGCACFWSIVPNGHRRD